MEFTSEELFAAWHDIRMSEEWPSDWEEIDDAEDLLRKLADDVGPNGEKIDKNDLAGIFIGIRIAIVAMNNRTKELMEKVRFE